MEHIWQQYAQQAQTVTYILVVIGLILAYILRNVIRNLVAMVLGYQHFITDHSIAIHKNRQNIAKNIKLFYTSEINPINAIIIATIPISALVSPILAAAILIGYKFNTIRNKFKKFTDFKIYDENVDEFIDFFNNNNQKIDLVVDELLNISYILLPVAFYFKSMEIGIIAVIIVAAILLANIFIVYNIVAYRLNHKKNEFHKMMRLIDQSAFNHNHSLLILAVFSVLSNFYLEGLSVYIWATLILRLFLKIAINHFLSADNKLKEEHKLISNRDFDLYKLASYPNFQSQSRGYKYTTPAQLKLFSLQKENGVTLNHYAFYNEAINFSDLSTNPILRQELQKIEIKINALDFTKQLFIIGAMGSGKTSFILNLVSQNLDYSKFKLMTFNDTKGDFTQKLYDPETDIIVNLYDRRAKAWCHLKTLYVSGI